MSTVGICPLCRGIMVQSTSIQPSQCPSCEKKRPLLIYDFAENTSTELQPQIKKINNNYNIQRKKGKFLSPPKQPQSAYR